MLLHSVSAVVGLLGSDGDLLSWLLLTVFLCWSLGIWNWDDVYVLVFGFVFNGWVFVPLFLFLL